MITRTSTIPPKTLPQFSASHPIHKPTPELSRSLSQDTVEIRQAQPRFAGHENITLAEAKAVLAELGKERKATYQQYESKQSEHAECSSTITRKQAKQEEEVQKTKEKGVLGGILIGTSSGAGYGALMGAGGDAAALGTTLGTMTAAGGALGGLGGALTGAFAGRDWAETQTRKKYAVPPELYSRRNRLESEKNDTFELWEKLKNRFNTREKEIEQAEKTLAGVRETHRIAKTAVSVAPFEDQHFHDLHTAYFKPKFLDDYQEGIDTKDTAKKVPGFAERFKALTKTSLGKEDAVEAILKDLGQDNTSQKLALQRLIQMEGNYPKHSKTVYPDFVKQPNQELAAIALEIITHHPELRPNQAAFNDTLVEILNSDKIDLIREALETIETLKPQDRRIDISLNQLGHDSNRLPELEGREAVLSLLGVRKAQGLVSKMDAKSVSGQAIRGFVGNTAVGSKLNTLIGNYYHTLENANHTGPALKVYLPGDAGIGKSLLVNRLQGALFGNPQQIIAIRPDDIRRGNRLADILRSQVPANSTGVHDLDQRIIFFDEFQGLDTIEPESERKKFLEDMKKLFAVNKTDVVAAQNWLRQEKLQMKHPVLALAINGETKDLQSIRQSQEGKALQSRLMTMVVPNSAHRLDLNPDITEHISEFIENFGTERYFENVNDVLFDGPVHLTSQAKAAFLKKFNDQAEYMGSIQGRTLADMMVADINQAITDAEGTRQFPFRRENTANGAGLITDSLLVDANADGEFSVATGRLNHTDTGSRSKRHSKQKAIEAPPVESSTDSEVEEEGNAQALVPYRPQAGKRRVPSFLGAFQHYNVSNSSLGASSASDSDNESEHSSVSKGSRPGAETSSTFLRAFRHYNSSNSSNASFNVSSASDVFTDFGSEEEDEGEMSDASHSSRFVIDRQTAENQAFMPYLKRFAKSVDRILPMRDTDSEDEG